MLDLHSEKDIKIESFKFSDLFFFLYWFTILRKHKHCTCVLKHSLPQEKFLIEPQLMAILCIVDHVTAVPSATSSHGAGPGVGVRLNSGWRPPKSTAIRYTKDVVPDREATKLEKFRSVLAGPNTDLGTCNSFYKRAWQNPFKLIFKNRYGWLMLEIRGKMYNRLLSIPFLVFIYNLRDLTFLWWLKYSECWHCMSESRFIHPVTHETSSPPPPPTNH